MNSIKTYQKMKHVDNLSKMAFIDEREHMQGRHPFLKI
jgi:hypothetical protein